MSELNNEKMWRFWDQSISAKNKSALESFAADDLLCEAVGNETSLPTVRTWVHDRTIVLGIQDHRLPHVTDAIDWLRGQGFDVIVRNSGGLAVVLDSGVLNVSLVFSERDAAIDIPAAYEMMVSRVRELFPTLADRIEAREIVGSYCPGTYDLSVDGKKFAGISQRRMRHGIAVQIYLCVEGSGSARAELIREFYTRGLQGETTKFVYPVIVPEVMASLCEITGEAVTVSEVVVDLQRWMNRTFADVHLQSLRDSEMDRYLYYLTRVHERNKKMLAK
ncbi:lipoate--protein ligase family protein [Paenisporosarcina cavernae]|uniref:Octanoyl-[GcvH]:protein N-octanoyltransferase n=1 Tax=Paenisporosarcina cavernae TaxID=2320858 RepID=A0A385YQM3_9BACL|nr:lipoate--protein ligase family protein [Paenisporosarcina cavernae]AYC28781.1 lipoate--protein ligase family protein [Paenisporosarcina cavernae]